MYGIWRVAVMRAVVSSSNWLNWGGGGRIRTRATNPDDID